MTMRRLCTTLLFLLACCCALAAEKSPTIVSINGSKYYVHTVQPGETLYALAKTYEVSEQVILELNPETANGLKANAKLKIPFVTAATQQMSDRKIRRTFDTHFVSRGETLYAIARKYEIPIQTLIADNPGLDPLRLSQGQRLLIRKKQIGSENEARSRAQWEEYRTTLNSLTDDGSAYHIVHPGETFYSLSRRFGISEEQLSALNGGLKPADLKAGAMIRVPGSDEPGSSDQETPEADTLQQSAPDLYADGKIREIEFRALNGSEPLKIALLLPLMIDRTANVNYLEFYQGFLLGLSELKNDGYSAEVTLFNTERSREKIEEILRSEAFAGTDLIVGPVYEEGLYPVIRYAEEHAVPVVSPLAHIASMNSDVLFQMAPAPDRKYEKAGELVNGDRHVTLIYAGTTDEDFEKEIRALLGDSEYDTYTYKYVHPSAVRADNNPSDLTPLLDNGQDNLFIVMADNEVDVDRILAAIASANTSLTSRGRTAPRFTVLGNARWNRYNNLDREIFFKDRVVFISTYHAKRDSQVIVDFDSNYIRAFGSLPTLYSYRGYDAAKIFAPAMYGDIEYDLEDRRYTPLQTTYIFRQNEGRHNHINQNWTRVNYNSDFTITIE